MERLEGLIFALIILTALPAWFVAAFSQAMVLRHTPPRHWFVTLFHLGWWRFKKAEQYIAPAGLPHLRRTYRAMVIFLGHVACASAYGLLILALKSASG